MELVTGKAGTPHVSSDDDGHRIAGEIGTESYILDTGSRLAVSLVDSNTVRFSRGDMIVQGRHIRLAAPEDVKVASGTQGKKRTDYICVHYKRDVAGSRPTLVETCEWKVLQGTPGTNPTTPSVPNGSILNGNADVTVPIAGVNFDGLTTKNPWMKIPVVTPLSIVGDTLYNTKVLYNGGGWYVAYKSGIVFVQAKNVHTGSGSWDMTYCPYVLTEQYRPRVDIYVPAITENGASWTGAMNINPNGKIRMQNTGNAGSADNRSAAVSWPI